MKKVMLGILLAAILSLPMTAFAGNKSGGSNSYNAPTQNITQN